VCDVFRGYFDAVVPLPRPPGVRPSRVSLHRQALISSYSKNVEMKKKKSIYVFKKCKTTDLFFPSFVLILDPGCKKVRIQDRDKHSIRNSVVTLCACMVSAGGHTRGLSIA
jgi:hypothetical protein